MITLEPAAQAIVDASSQPPYMFQLPIEVGRARLHDLQSGDVDKPDAEITDLDLDTRAGRVPVRIVRPRGAVGALPVVLYLHAGWAFGDVVSHDRFIRVIADRVGAAVVFPSFTRSPEARYPTAIEQIYSVAEWVAADGHAHELDASQLAIGGDSAGGNMATAVAMLSKRRSGPRFVHQLLFYATLDATFDSPSYQEFATGFNVRRDHMQWLWDQYLPDISRRTEITAAPLRATTEDLEGLPPATIITAEADVVRDDGELYASKLREAGVNVTAVRYLGTIHDFMVVNALRDTNAARAATDLTIAKLRDAFDRGSEYDQSGHGSSGSPATERHDASLSTR